MKMVASLFALLLASTLMAQQQPSGNSRSAYNDQFGVLSEHNMFVKDRVRGRGDGSTSRPSTQPEQSPLTPEESYILRGVVYENDLFTAYFENLNTSRIEAVNAGAELAQVKIAEIALDAVLLEKNGQTQWIVIGRDLRGAQARQMAKAAPTTAAPGTTTADPSTLSIEERLRQRRAQERGGR